MKNLADKDGIVHLRRLTPDLHTVVAIEDDALDADIKKGIFLDTETTGLDKNIDTVIEVAILPILFNCKTGSVYAIGDVFTQQQDPGRPLDPVVTEKTGITDEMLKGKAIDWRMVHGYIAEADIVIAHNAGFDRAFIDRALNTEGLDIKSKVWACSFKLLTWDAPVSKLEVLVPWVAGVWYDAHRADADVHALLYLLNREGRLAALYTAAHLPSYEVQATKSPFDRKDMLKQRGYRWSDAKVWYNDSIPDKAALVVELNWLSANIYMRPCLDIVQVREIAPDRRFGIGE